jgi:hypothetical protein
LSQKDSPLAPYLLRTLREVTETTADWIVNKNTERPHDSLRDLMPHKYLMINTEVGNSKTAWHYIRFTDNRTVYMLTDKTRYLQRDTAI